MTDHLEPDERATTILRAWEHVTEALASDEDLAAVPKLAETDNSIPELEALMRQRVGEGATSLRHVAESLTSQNSHANGHGNRRGDALTSLIQDINRDRRDRVPLGLLIRVRLIATEEDFDRAIHWLREGRELRTDAHDRVLHPDTGEVLGLVQKTQPHDITLAL